MSNPFPILGVIVLYLAIVLKWGPDFMKNRQPIRLNAVIQIYNAAQVIICGFLVIEVSNIFLFLFHIDCYLFKKIYDNAYFHNSPFDFVTQKDIIGSVNRLTFRIAPDHIR